MKFYQISLAEKNTKTTFDKLHNNSKSINATVKCQQQQKHKPLKMDVCFWLICVKGCKFQTELTNNMFIDKSLPDDHRKFVAIAIPIDPKTKCN